MRNQMRKEPEVQTVVRPFSCFGSGTEAQRSTPATIFAVISITRISETLRDSDSLD
jgi:hypothetical protein